MNYGMLFTRYYPSQITTQMILTTQQIKKSWNISKRNCTKRAENHLKSQDSVAL